MPGTTLFAIWLTATMVWILIDIAVWAWGRTPDFDGTVRMSGGAATALLMVWMNS
jgi:hypothetical protein